MTGAGLRFLVVLLSFLAAGALSAKPVSVDWADLAPPAPAIDDPFQNLSNDQKGQLRKLLTLRLRIEVGESGLESEAKAQQSSLEEQGLDVEWLFAKRLEIMEARAAAATGVNETLVGQDVRLPGYVLPLEIRNRRVVEFLLVPTVGACIHTPPPPANQMVHVNYPNGIEVTGLFTPVWISGRLDAEKSEKVVSYVDGQSRVTVSYTMQPEDVEPY